jgi:uncharacterized protein (TIGR02996 family)
MPVVEQNMEQAFLADILAHPQDDTPRLVYADWLTERDGPGDALRAEFIRVQCRLTALALLLPPHAWNPRSRALCEERYRLLAREQYLYSQGAQGGDLNDLLPARHRVLVTEQCWRRGFLECLTLEDAEWCREHRFIREVAPIQHVTFTGRMHWVVRPPMQGEEDVLCYLPAVAMPAFATLPFSIWRQRPKKRFYLPWLACQLWPEITFHGPDFDWG